MGDLVLFSGVSGEKHGDNLNFLDPYASDYLVQNERNSKLLRNFNFYNFRIFQSNFNIGLQ